MTFKIVLDKIQARFYNRLNEKSGWGKNEIRELYKTVCLEVLAELIPDPPLAPVANVQQAVHTAKNPIKDPHEWETDEDLPF